MKKKINDLEAIKDLFYTYLELLEKYRELFGKDTQDITKAKHNVLAMQTPAVFNLLNETVIVPNEKQLFTVLNNICACFSNENVLELDSEVVDKMGDKNENI